jgi:chemotaxis protein MotA
MDWASLLGFGFAALLVGGALLLAQVPLQSLVHPAGWLLVLGGTATAVLLSFSTSTLFLALNRASASLFRHERPFAETIETLVDIAQFMRAQGSLAISPYLQEWQSSEPWLYKGLSLMVDNVAASVIQERLQTEVDLNYRQALDEIQVFEAAGGYAPTMGLIGALVGLMHTLSHMQQVALVGQGVASAFSSTLLGLAVANLLLLPLAAKLRQQARQDWLRGQLLLNGVQAIANHEHPVAIRERLMAFLSQEGQVAMQQQGQYLAEDTEHQARYVQQPVYDETPVYGEQNEEAYYQQAGNYTQQSFADEAYQPQAREESFSAQQQPSLQAGKRPIRQPARQGLPERPTGRF